VGVAVNERIGLLELLIGLSGATDLGMGLQAGESVRSAALAAGLARALELDDEGVREALYSTLLLHLGCSAYAHERSAAFGDEVALNAASVRTNFLEPRSILTEMVGGITRGAGLRERARVTGYMLLRGNSFGLRATTATCEVGRRLAARLELAEGVQRALYESFEYWNGQGTPAGLKGEEIALAARIARVASTASLFAGSGGAQLAAQALSERAGGMLDPGICELFRTHADELLAELEATDPGRLVLDGEQAPHASRERGDLVELAAVFADLVDLKTPFTHGHSRGVARLAAGAAERLQLGADAVAQLELAGLLHDLGRTAVSTSVWEKPGPLSAAEWEEVRLHPYRSERILSASGPLGSIATLAGAHHERLDSSGYHRACKAAELPPPARVLASADAFQAMTQPRPHREALEPERAAEQLGAEARAGRLDPDTVAAVLEVAGQRQRRRRADLRPAGLTEREVQVLALIAAGRSNREIAERLVISRRTAEHHVQSIYAKIGDSSRAATAVFALEHGLVG
jgi:HD-GYP domain-containing protein (c-di-GMP phosphodiesterase class II)